MLVHHFAYPLRTPTTMPTPQAEIQPAQNASLLRRTFFACFISLFGAIVCAACGLVFLICHGPGLLLVSAATIRHTPRISMKLKGLALLLLVPLATLAALLLFPAITAYGLMAGFAQAYACPEWATLRKLSEQTQNLLGQTLSDLLARLSSISRARLAPGEVAFDIPLLKLLAALSAGLAGGLIVLLAVLIYLGLLSLPVLCRWDYLFLSKSTQPLLIRLVLLLFSPLCAVLLFCLAPLAGMMYGALFCARQNYLAGWRASLTGLGQTLRSWHQQFMKYLF